MRTGTLYSFVIILKFILNFFVVKIMLITLVIVPEDGLRKKAET
jgi:hypothetical protein